MGTHPPFRAENIGSLLRPARLLALRQKFNRGEVVQQELGAAENAVTAQARLDAFEREADASAIGRIRVVEADARAM